MWHHYKLQAMKRTDFIFCPDDIEHCVKGPRQKWVMPFSVDDQKPPILPIWPVKIGTNLTHSEIFAFENACFQLPLKERITPTRLFTTSATPLDMSRIRIPENPDFIPTTRLSKLVRRSSNAPSAKQRQLVASVEAMHGTILKLTIIPQPGFGCIITLQSKSEPQPPIYQIIVSYLPECNYAYFLDMISKFSRKRNSYQNCTHLYYIFIKFSNLDADVNSFIHAPTFSFNEVKLILEGGLLTQSTSFNSSQPSTTLGYDICVHLWTSCEAIIDSYNKNIVFIIIFILFKVSYYNISYVYQFYFRFAYFLHDSKGGGPG
jgi:hypothetical protein